MLDLNKFKVVVSEESNTFTKFEIGPLYKGFGHTIGNAIRRILLTYIPGSAITSVKINGVDHEYTALDGLQEDVLAFILNLKNIAIKSHSEQPVSMSLSLSGKKGDVVEIKAGDFACPSDIEVINPDLVVGHVTMSQSKLEVEVTVENGVGYKLPDQSKRAEIGVIPVDALFSPVKHVKMDINQTRVGQQTDFDSIVMEVHTNGASTPKQVFLQAVEIFDLVANRLVDLGGGDSENNKFVTLEDEPVEKEVRKLSIYDIAISTRLRNALLNSKMTDLMEMEKYSRNEILNMKGMGKKSFDELMALLSANGVNIKE